MLRLGTRGSALALAQARWVADRLPGDVDLVVVVTAGDRDRAAGDKSRWTGALEQGLLDGELDLAVHSAKDVPADLAPGTALVAAPARADPRDVLVGAATLEELPLGARVGTSALRRRAQLCAVRPDLEVVEVRGNVDTRLRQLAAGDVDALVLARAGLERLGRAGEAGGPLDGGPFVPSAGQGTLALQARADDPAAGAARRVLDPAAWTELRAERAAITALEASCHTPVGIHARAGEATLRLRGFAGRPDGSTWVLDELEDDPADPEAAGTELAARMLAAGARELLEHADTLA